MEGLRNSFRLSRTKGRRLIISIPRSPTGFGFTVAWTKPPEVNHVSEGGQAARRGLLPGDKIVSINKTKISKKGKDEVTEIVKNVNNEMELEIYREENRAIRRYASMREARDRSAPSVYNKELNISWRRERILLQLLQCEESLLSTLQLGKERYVIPLRRQNTITTSVELELMFGNFQEVYSVHERLYEKLKEGIERNPHQAGSIYREQLNDRFSCLGKYLRDLPLAKVLLNYKYGNLKFSALVESLKKQNDDMDILEFIEKPLKYIQQLVTLLESLMSSTAVGHQDYVNQEDVVRRFRDFEKSVSDSVRKESFTGEDVHGNSLPEADEPYPKLEKLQKKLVFTTGLKRFDLIHPGRYWIFAGQLLKVEGKYYVQYLALLLSDSIVLTRKTRQGIHLILESPLMLDKIRKISFNVPRCEKEFHVYCESELEEDSACSSSQIRDPPMKTVVFRAPSFALKLLWKKMLTKQITEISELFAPKEIACLSRSEESFRDCQKNCRTSLTKSASASDSEFRTGDSGRNRENMFRMQKIKKFLRSKECGHQSDVRQGKGNQSMCDSSSSTPDQPALRETAFREEVERKAPILYIDSSEDISSGTESYIYAEDKTSLHNATSEDMALCDGKDYPSKPETADSYPLLRTLNKFVQTDLMCSSSCVLVKKEISKCKTFPRLGTFEKLAEADRGIVDANRITQSRLPKLKMGTSFHPKKSESFPMAATRLSSNENEDMMVMKFPDDKRVKVPSHSSRTDEPDEDSAASSMPELSRFRFRMSTKKKHSALNTISSKD